MTPFNLARERADAYSESLALRALHQAHRRPIRVAPRIRWDDHPDPEPRQLSECGTPTAYKRHLANSEDCPTCRAWNTQRARQYRAQRKAVA